MPGSVLGWDGKCYCPEWLFGSFVKLGKNMLHFQKCSLNALRQAAVVVSWHKKAETVNNGNHSELFLISRGLSSGLFVQLLVWYLGSGSESITCFPGKTRAFSLLCHATLI